MSFQPHSHVQSRPPRLRAHTLLSVRLPFPVCQRQPKPLLPNPGANATSCSHPWSVHHTEAQGTPLTPKSAPTSSAPSPPVTQLLPKAHGLHVCKATCVRQCARPDLTGQPSTSTQHTLSCDWSPSQRRKPGPGWRPTPTAAPAASPLTSKQVEVIGVQELKAKKGEDHFHGERASVHKVAIKYLPC